MKSRVNTTLILFVILITGASLADEKISADKSECVDQIVSKVIVDPALDSEFFRAKDSSYPFHIIEHEDGHLENTLGGEVSKEDVIKIEHTANCMSTHQGEHLMSFCDAQLIDEGLLLEITGGLSAYTSSLTLSIDKNKNIECRFDASYPMNIPGEQLTWKITKKTFKMKNDNTKEGDRLLGWLSVEFDEISTKEGIINSKSFKIEGFVKPVINRLPLDSKAIIKDVKNP